MSQGAIEACLSPPFGIDLVGTGAAAPLGVVWQLGAEFHLTEHWRGVLSATYAAPDTEATFTGPAGAASADLEIEAWLIGLGVGYRF